METPGMRDTVDHWKRQLVFETAAEFGERLAAECFNQEFLVVLEMDDEAGGY